MKMENKKFSGWIANLSDGSTVFQNDVPGERSSWQQLLKRLRDTDGLEMTMLRLQHHGTTVMCMPKKMCDGYMQAYEVEKKLIRGTGPNAEKERVLQGVGSVVGDTIFLNWMDIVTGDVYQEARPIITPEGSNSSVHTTLYEEPNGQRPRNETETG